MWLQNWMVDDDWIFLQHVSPTLKPYCSQPNKALLFHMNPAFMSSWLSHGRTFFHLQYFLSTLHSHQRLVHLKMIDVSKKKKAWKILSFVCWSSPAPWFFFSKFWVFPPVFCFFIPPPKKKKLQSWSTTFRSLHEVGPDHH